MCSVTLNFADWLEAIFCRSFWHIFWHSFWHIFWHSFWHIFWHSFWYLLTFFLTYLLTFFLTYLLTFFLTYLLTCFLTYLLTFFLTDQRQNIASTASHKATPQTLIFTLHHAAKVISMTTLRLSNDNSTVAFDCIEQPRQEAVESKDAKRL